jgi:hypothetical protein
MALSTSIVNVCCLVHVPIADLPGKLYRLRAGGKHPTPK